MSFLESIDSFFTISNINDVEFSVTIGNLLIRQGTVHFNDYYEGAYRYRVDMGTLKVLSVVATQLGAPNYNTFISNIGYDKLNNNNQTLIVFFQNEPQNNLQHIISYMISALL